MPINYIEEAFMYFILGGIFHTIITVFLTFFVLPIDLIRNNYSAGHQLNRFSFPLTRRLYLFSSLLFLWGFLGYFLFLATVTNRYYIPGDPLVDWLPLLPRGCSIFCPDFGGKLINGATCNTLKQAWLLVAVPVWVASFLSYRYVQGLWKRLRRANRI